MTIAPLKCHFVRKKKAADEGKEEKPRRPEGLAIANPSRSLTKLYGPKEARVEQFFLPLPVSRRFTP